MKKVTGMVVAVMAVLVLASAAFAWWDGPGMGYGPGSYSGANAETMKKFQKETFSLRDELAGKQLDLQAEYDKPVPDTARIASIKKDIIDIQAKIQVVADKHGIPAWGPGSGRGMMMGRNMMMGRGMMGGGGCSCPRCQ
jgi:hypothetical protein